MLLFTAEQIMTPVGIILQDQSAVRWPLEERMRWINAAMREIAILKPSATAETIELSLAEGTLQRLPPGYHQLLEAVCNIPTTAGAGPAGGRSIFPIAREEIDSLIPNWHDPTVLPYSKDVYYVTDDTNDPTAFYVVPGNTGFGRMEMVASTIWPGPGDQIPTGANLEDMATYAAVTLPLSNTYQTAVTDFVLYRCYSKEVNIGGASAKAQAHLALFQQALGVKTATDAAMNVNAPRQRPAM